MLSPEAITFLQNHGYNVNVDHDCLTILINKKKNTVYRIIGIVVSVLVILIAFIGPVLFALVGVAILLFTILATSSGKYSTITFYFKSHQLLFKSSIEKSIVYDLNRFKHIGISTREVDSYTAAHLEGYLDYEKTIILQDDKKVVDLVSFTTRKEETEPEILEIVKFISDRLSTQKEVGN
jgi:hypothetical protein